MLRCLGFSGQQCLWWCKEDLQLFPTFGQEDALTQNEGASLCGLFPGQLCVLLRVVKLQRFHEGLKTSVALSTEDVQQTTCVYKKKSGLTLSSIQ